MKIKIRRYKESGNLLKEYFFEDIQEALKKYVEIRDGISNFWKHRGYWPTIWINTNERFLRVHDFAYGKLTDETIEKYLNERIIDTDDLLAQFSNNVLRGKKCGC